MVLSDYEYLELVDKTAALSKDLSVGIGAVLVGPGGHLTNACNELPRGVEDRPERRERPAKYLFTEHAERAAIYDAARNGISTSGTILYTTGIPCADCARAVICAGIATVVVWKRGSGLEKTDRWYESIKAGEAMLREAGVQIVEVER